MLLKPFRLLTKMGQEKNTPLGSIGSVLRSFDMLLEVLEKTREKYNIEKPDEKKKNQKLSHLARECNRSGCPTFPGSSQPRFHRVGQSWTKGSRFNLDSGSGTV